MDESSEITGSFHFANKASLQAHFILVETRAIMAGAKFAMIVRYFAGGCFTRYAVACGHPLVIVMAGIVAELSHPLHEGGGTSWL